jgi:hypothetical protein
LIKLNLSDTNAAALATATGVEPGVLAEVATNIKKRTALSTTQSDVYARFDLIVTALLDQPTSTPTTHIATGPGRWRRWWPSYSRLSADTH